MEDWKLKPAADHGLSPLDAAKSYKRESGLVSTATHVAWWSVVRAFQRVYHRLEIHGAHHIPHDPPFILVANHSSHLDALVLAAPLPARLRDRVFPIAAADVFFESPSVTFFAAMMLNALPMYRANRGRHALAELRDRMLNEPCSYILFPEGARSRDGNMLPVKSGIGMIIAGTNVPVVPCWLDGCFNAMKPGQLVPRPKKIRVFCGEAVTFPDQPNKREGWDAIAQTLEQRIHALRPPP